MDKINVTVSAPVDTYSGYGARSRDIVRSLLKTNKYNIQILSQRWGNTRFGYLEDHNEDEIASLIIPKLAQKPDVWFQITVPNEFQPVGKYNIGITAGIETNTCDPSWIEGCNRMNLVLTSSKHSKDVFETSIFDVANKQSKQNVGKLKLKTKVEVLFEGIDPKKFFPKSTKAFDLECIKEDFCFLFVGHWLKGSYGHDRKNVGYMIKSFLETFKVKKNPPALILKTSLVGTSIMDRDTLIERISEIKNTVKGSRLPSIYVVHGEVTDEDMNNLYNHPKVKAMVSLTKGEGFGRPLLEFTFTKKPVLASGWSGQIDFLDNKKSLLIGGNLHKLDNSSIQKNVLIPESEWFQPADGEVSKKYRAIHKHYKDYLALAKDQGRDNIKNFSLSKMKEKLESILDNNLPEFPKKIELTLPKLDLPKLEV
tara:strand:- start:8933 stop:10204 length:1272 start_codon:yes stop_codon:yes gene_type:complete